MLLFLDPLFATPIANVTVQLTVSMASTPVHNLFKTGVKRKIQLEETEKLFILQVPVVDVLKKLSGTI